MINWTQGNELDGIFLVEQDYDGEWYLTNKKSKHNCCYYGWYWSGEWEVWHKGRAWCKE